MTPHLQRSRRSFVRFGLATSIGVVGLSLAACAAPSSAPTSTEKPATAAPSTGATPAAKATAASTSAAPAPTSASKPAASMVDLKQLEEAAKREGRITYYANINPETTQALVKAFTERHGVEVDVVRLASGPLAQRYASEAEAGNVVADIVQVGDPDFMEEATKKGWLAKLEGLPALEGWPSKFRTETYAVANIGLNGIVWNTEMVKPDEAPKTWQDLLAPRWKGQILLVDPRTAPVILAWIDLLSQHVGEDFFRRLAQQEPRIVTSAVLGRQQVAAGAAPILLPSPQGGLGPLLAEGAPLAEVVPEPTVGNEALAGISAKAPHPNGARLLMNYILTPEGQSAFTKDGYSTVLPNVPGASPVPASYRTPDIPAALAKRDHLLELIGISG